MQRNLTKIITSIFWVLICSIMLVHSSESQEKNNTSRSFEVKLNKNSYLLYEPIFVHFQATLLNGEEKPIFRHETSIKVTYQGETKDFGVLSQSEAPQRLPKVNQLNLGVSSKEKQPSRYQADENIERVGEFFPEPGVYQIQFFWHKSSDVMASNPVEVTIQEPMDGIDKLAFDVLKKYEGPTSFNWVWKEKNGVSMLENFVAKYGESVYGEPAIRYLANVYKARDELDKAQTEFEKIRLSNNKPVSDEANKALQEIEQRRIQLKKSS